MSGAVDFRRFDNSWFQRGAPRWKELLWLFASALFFQHSLCFWNAPKIWLLRAFGAVVGKGVLIKPRVTIKFPWNLRLGDYVWIGEEVRIDNLAPVVAGDHVCVSQGAMLQTGNHDYSRPGFDLIVRPICLENGSWVGARAVVCPGVTLFQHSVLGAGAVATRNLEAFGIYQGNPAVLVRKRVIRE